jgi:hypothetical protein
MMKEEDGNSSWNYSYAPAMAALWGSDFNNVPDMWLSADKKKPREKMKKKKRDKIPNFGFQEGVSMNSVVISIIFGH